MAYFALIEKNIVTQVIVVDDEDCDNLQFPESEPIGQSFISNIGLEGDWLQTSTDFRGIYAGLGCIYDPVTDQFYPPTQLEEPTSE